jgi:hypothetical protein
MAQVILLKHREVIESKKMIKDYEVVRAFEATAPISGRRRQFEPGDVIACEMGQAGPRITIEADSSLFLVERSAFKTCCKVMGHSAAGI